MVDWSDLEGLSVPEGRCSPGNEILEPLFSGHFNQGAGVTGVFHLKIQVGFYEE